MGQVMLKKCSKLSETEENYFTKQYNRNQSKM